MKLKKSLKMLSKAKKLIPGASQTFSKGPTQFAQGVAPNFLEKGEGCYVYDLDGNKFIDYTMALGPVILGYNYSPVNKAIMEQLSKGSTFTLPSPVEVELAEILVNIIPCAEMVRYGKNGSDVTSAAVRVARAYTGREKIACCGYHGWQDWYIGTTTRDKGVPGCVKNLTYTFEYNNIDRLKKIFEENRDEIAAVIMEPISTVEPEGNFLEEVKKLTHENGALLIFDEVVTGFRIALGGAQEYYNVIPDLACFGKGMANGMPISAIVGKKEIMKEFEEVFFSFTFGGETLSIAAAIATIKELKEKNVIYFLWAQGRKLSDGVNELIRKHKLEKHVFYQGLPPRAVMGFRDEKGDDDLELKSLFQQEAIRRGVLFTGAHNISFSHTDDVIERTLEIYDEVMSICKDTIEENNIKERLEGPTVQPVFRKI
jgi:glutamate-1-semialdehyde 2,1-aminomutase/spore coat polysaccharide biosynthesis protein SpsF